MLVKSIYPIIAYFTTLLPFASSISSSTMAEDYFNPMYDYALPATTHYAVLSLVCFLIPIIFTITLARSLAQAFGGEPQFYGLSKMI
jgi:hypothetical protein